MEKTMENDTGSAVIGGSYPHAICVLDTGETKAEIVKPAEQFSTQCTRRRSLNNCQ